MVIITVLLLVAAFIVLMRFIGAWMFRINEIINQQGEMINQQSKIIALLGNIKNTVDENI